MTKKLKNVLKCLFSLIILAYSTTKAQNCIEPANFNGRIAWTADGNSGDRDDFLATPYMAAILQAADVQLVHLAYNNQLSGNNGDRPQVMRRNVNRSINAYNSLGNNIFDCNGDRNSPGTRAGISHLARLIRDASGSSRLYICVAGPAFYVLLALREANRLGANRQDYANVTIVGHSFENNRNGLPVIMREANGGDFDGLVIANYATNGSIHNDELFVDLSEYAFIENNRTRPLIEPLWLGYLDTEKRRFDPSDAGMAYMVLYFTDVIDSTNVNRMQASARSVQPSNFVQEARDLDSGDPFCTNGNGGNGNSNFFYIQTRGNNPRRLASRNNNGGSTLRHVSGTATGNNAQWEMISSSNGFFFLQNRASGMFFRPQNNNVGANLVQVSTSARGNRTQWQQIATNNGFFRLENRSAGRHFSTGRRGAVTLSDATGNNSQWQFVPVGASKNLEIVDTENNDILVYPNPATDVINVSSNNEAGIITIMNITGAVVFKGEFQQNFNTNISHLDNGLYIVQIATENTTNVTKLVKQ